MIVNGPAVAMVLEFCEENVDKDKVTGQDEQNRMSEHSGTTRLNERLSECCIRFYQQ